MKEIYFLTENKYLFGSLNRYLKYNCSACLNSLIPHEMLKKDTEDICHKYNYICDIVKSILTQNKSPLIIIDTFSNGLSIETEVLNIRSNGNLSAMLYLTFPEVYWVFLSVGYQSGEKDNEFFNSTAFEKLHILDCKNIGELKKNFERIYKAYNNKYEPLFDPTGFRNLLRSKIFIDHYGNMEDHKKYLTNRNASAISIDDEINYSYFYSYYAYSNGLRVWNINSYKFFETFGSKDNDNNFTEITLDDEIKYSFEDLFISYYDKPGDDPDSHLSKLEDRSIKLKFLKKIENRILLTVGHSNKKFRNIKLANEIYINKHNGADQKIKTVYKPMPSLYGLGKKVPIISDAFKWPLKIKEFDKDKYHSSPGRVKEIAERMILRAEKILEKRDSLPDLIRGAVIAREAHELLANRTPTITLRALDVRHELEVTFECLFEGVDYSLHAKERIAALKKEVTSICKWFQKGKIRRRAEISSLSSIIGKLIIRFRENNQFDEEDYALSELRKLQGKLLLLRSNFFKIFYPFRWYLEMLLRSIRFFVFAVLFWIILFATIWYFNGLLMDKCGNNPDFTTYILHSLQAFLSFSVNEKLIDNTDLIFIKLFLVGMPLVIGFVHLGVFITHLYNKFLRR